MTPFVIVVFALLSGWTTRQKKCEVWRSPSQWSWKVVLEDYHSHSWTLICRPMFSHILGTVLLKLLWRCMLTFMSRIQFLPSPPFSEQRYCDAWHHAVVMLGITLCVAASVSVAKVMCCIHCSRVVMRYCKTVLWHALSWSRQLTSFSINTLSFHHPCTVSFLPQNLSFP